MIISESNPSIDIDTQWLLDTLEELQQKAESKKIRRENPYVLDLIKVLWRYKAGFGRTYVIDRIWELRQSKDLPMPKTFESTVQSAFNSHCEDSTVFRKRDVGPEQALFYSVGGKGSGRWAVHHQRAKEWVSKKKIEYEDDK
jgi:hypothetical protein